MIKKFREFKKTTLGIILTAIIYFIMLCLVLVFFTGHGVFIYEAV